ncbi:DUF1840 domain-containing protein [Hydrogenophaga sp.]|uniref:DUF1840 domain-containing protein n=1 Tax=Hydrogenophaga sp. TaxID=1904254 RepID=UPI00271EA527|nr:DUF1840 domain-containing protein [Hydrogenophaga sp.]MDO9434913.1 DUF1840 domain-containing protein [Hydrogenophaga sp.]
MSIFRFKSRETGDLVMLHAHGQRLLEIVGKDPSGPGVIQPSQMPAAVSAIHAAVAADEAKQKQKQVKEEATQDGDAAPDGDTVSLRMRAAPFVEMLERCEKAGVDIVWGV